MPASRKRGFLHASLAKCVNVGGDYVETLMCFLKLTPTVQGHEFINHALTLKS